MAPAPASHRIAQLDALRAIAALLVLITHATEVFQRDAPTVPSMLFEIAHAMDFGRIGVVLFFLISGYVVASTLARPTATARRFLVRRFFRLYPLYWTSVAIACVVLQQGIVDAATLAANLTMVPTLLGREAYMGLYWTLETELAFYGLAMVFFGAGVLRHPGVLLAAIGVAIAVFAGFMFGILPAPSNLSWKSFPLNLAFMVVGLLAHHWHSTLPAQRRMARAALLAGIALSLLPSAYSLVQALRGAGADNLRWAVAYPAAVALFFWLLDSRARVLRPLAALGLVSYSMYLLHPFALGLVGRVVMPLGELVQAWGTVAGTTIAVLATVMLSTATYLAIERPINRLARRWTGERIER